MEIAVISGKGGTGKSSIAAALAMCKTNTMIVDCDVDAANLYLLFNPTHTSDAKFITGHKAKIDYKLCTNCGICTAYCQFEAISFVENRVKISETACDGCFLCSRLCPNNAIAMITSDKSRVYTGTFRNGHMVYGRLSPGEENSGKLVNKVRSLAKNLANEHNISTIILDGPPGIGCPVISTVTGVDITVVVTEPTISGLHDLQRTLDMLDLFHLKKTVIINKFDLNTEMSNFIENYCQNRNVAVLGQLPFDTQMVEAMVNRQTILEWNKDSEIAKLIIEISKKLKI